MLAPRHFAAMQEQIAIDAILGPTEQVSVPVPEPVIAPTPESAAPSAASRPCTPDLPFDLRCHLGLQ